MLSELSRRLKDYYGQTVASVYQIKETNLGIKGTLNLIRMFNLVMFSVPVISVPVISAN